MFHPRQLALSGMRIRPKQIIRDQQPQHRISEKLERFIVHATGLRCGARRHLLVCPRTMRHRLCEQIAISKVIADDVFEVVEVFQAA